MPNDQMTTALSKDAIAALIAAHAPYLYMHPDERFMPSSFDWFLDQPGVTLGDPRQHHPVPRPLGAQTETSYIAYPWDDPGIKPGKLATMKTYVHTKPYDGDGAGGLEVQYWFFSPFNGPGNATMRMNLSFTSLLKDWDSPDLHINIVTNPFGEHQCDWEHVTLFFNGAQKLVRISAAEHNYATDYYPPGTPGQATWEEENGRPVFYSSLNGHASFGSAGAHLTRGKGLDIDPSVDVKVFSVGVALKAGLVNFCAKGQRADCAANLDWIANDIAGIDVPAPGWLPFQGRCGWVDPPMGDTSKQFREEFEAAFMAVLRPVLPGFLEPLASEIVDKVTDEVAPPLITFIANHTEDFNGIKMPSWTA